MSPSRKTKHPVLWITGASSGIGEYLARHAAHQGWQVAISARSIDKLTHLAGESAHIHAFPLDVLDRDKTEHTLQQIEEKLGAVDIAVLNAGTHADMPVEEFDGERADQIIRLNLTGITNGIAALLPDFLARRSGHLALMASVAGYRGLPRAAAYCASKAGVIALAESLAAETGHKGLKIQVICPGFVRTPLSDLNDFRMPFLMEPEEAAGRIFRGLQSNRFEIAFPRRFAWQLKCMRYIPGRWYFTLIRKITQSERP